MRLYEINDKSGIFAGVHFSSTTIDAIIKYQKDNNIPNPLDSKEFHSTVVYNKSPIINFRCLDELSPSWKGKFKEMILLPSDANKALCIEYECAKLTARWQQVLDMGAAWDYPSFIPHITISYDIGDTDISTFPPYPGPIEIVEEFCNPLDPNYIKS